MLRTVSWIVLGLAFILANFPSSSAARNTDAAKETADEFFIVSEVNLRKHEVVMEEPSQITLTMNLTGKTVFQDDQGHALPINDLQAGETVYATYELDSKGAVTALTIREGPMTVEELHRRYFPS
jgi:hypothetical protein